MKKLLLPMLGILFLISCERGNEEQEPIACFNANKTSVVVGEIIQFTNCSENASSYGWSFGDGTTSTSENTEHKYEEAGTFNVRLKVYQKNLNDEATLTIVVEDEDDPSGDIVLTTTTVTQITATSAVGGGNISSDGGAAIEKRGICWSTQQQPTIDDNISSNGSGTGEYTSQMTGLTPGTTYYVKAYATNENETAYGNEVSFTTTSDEPDYPLISADPDNFTAKEPVTITYNAALGDKGLMGYDGEVYAHTGINTVHGDWRYNQADWTENIEKLKMTRIGTDLYTLEIPNSIHDFYDCPLNEHILSLAFVFRNSDGGLSGRMENEEDIILDVATIEPFEPVVYTYDPTDITTNSVKTGGIVVHNGFKQVTQVGICYNTTGTPTINDQQTNDGQGWIEFFTTLENLTENTTYYAKAYAVNEIGTGYGREISFTTANSNQTILFEEPFKTDLGQFSQFNILGENIWIWDTFDDGCTKMSGYNNGSFANEDWLVSPGISLSNNEAFLEFRHAINYVGGDWDKLQVLISVDFDGTDVTNASWKSIQVPNWGTGDNWTFINSGEISLQQYSGQTIYIAFKYMSDANVSSTWEIGSFKVYTLN